MSFKTRTLALSLLMSIVIAIMSGCAGEVPSASTTENAAESTQPTSGQPEDVLDYLGEQDFGGKEFHMLTISAGINATSRFTDEIYVKEETGEVINDSVYLRNKMVEDKLNVKIVAVPQDNPMSSARAAVKAGDASYHTFGLYKSETSSMAQEGALRNWNDLPVMDFSKPWWNSKCAQNMSVGGFLYCMSGSILISEIDDTLAMVFNKKLATDYMVEDLYTLVKEKRWTIDKMGEIVKNISSDINGDGKNKPADDLFGYVQDPASMTFNWAFSSGLATGKISGDGIYDPNLDVSRAQAVVDKLYGIFADGKCAYSGLDLYEGIDYFVENRIFLYAIILRNVELLRGMEVDFGILPYPLFDENQPEYITHVGAASPILSIPVTNTEDELTGTVLEAMAAASYKVVIPAYYDVALKVKMSRDEESGDMLDIILASRTYDIPYYSGNSIAHLMAGLINSKKTTLTSEYEKKEPSMTKNVQKFIDKITQAG